MQSYLTLLRIPGIARITAWQLFARLPLGMLSLSILLHVHAITGSYGQAGTVVACVSVAEALAIPVMSRLTGIVGVSTVTLPSALVNGCATAALAIVPPNLPLMCVLGVSIGASVPPLMPVVRALYPQMVPPEVVGALFALDTAAQELIWVVGPVAATFLATTMTTVAPLFVAGVVTIVGSVGFLVTLKRRTPRIPRSESSFGRVLGEKQVVLAMVASLALVASFMALEVGVVAEHGNEGVIAGVAIAVSSLGSLIGGILLGHRHLGLHGLVATLVIVAGGTASTGLIDSLALQFVALFVAGFGFAPALATLYLMVSDGVDEKAAAETFGWMNTGALAGAAVGTALGGAGSDALGAAGAYGCATALALAAAVSPLVVRMTGPIRGLNG